MKKPVSMLCIYRIKRGKEARFRRLLLRQWPTLRRAGLVSSRPARLYRGRDKKDGSACFVEMFQWKDDRSSGAAHESPEVMALWNPMMPLLEDMELIRIEPM
jgi:hypothetical protein